MAVIVRSKFFNRWIFILNISGFCIFRPTITKDDRVVLKPSILLIFLTIAELFGLITILALQIYFGINYCAEDFTGTLILDSIFFGGLVVSFFQILFSLLQTKSLAQYGESMVDYNRDLTHSDLSKFISSSKKFFLPFFFIYLFSFAWDSTFFFIIQDPLLVLHLLALYVAHYYNLLVISQYSMAIFGIKNKLEMTNEKLRRLKSQFRVGGLKIRDIPLKSVLNNQIGVAASKKNIHILNAVEEIKQHRQSYQSIYDLCLKANKAFSAKLLLAIGYNFVMATLFIYFSIQKTSSIYTKGWDTIEFWYLTTSFRVAITHLLSIYGLIYASDLVCTQVSKIVKTIHMMLIEMEEPQLEAQLHVFLVQIQYQKIAFSPHSFFELNKSLLLKILGAISSYLIILLQFRVEL